MRWTIEFGDGAQDVTVATTGDATVDGFARMNAELLSDERFQPGMRVLLDHSDLVVDELSTHDVRAISHDFGRHEAEMRTAIVAIVAPQPLQYGLTRMSVSLAEPQTPTIDVFYTRSEAVEWLQRQRDLA